MSEVPLRKSIARLIAIRVVISTILLGSATFTRVTEPGSFAVDPFFFLIGVPYALTIGYAVTLRLVERHRWLVDLQLAMDALLVSAFIYFTGGITSYFTSLYVLPMIAASTIQFRRGGLFVATLSAVLYVGLVVAQYLAASGLRTIPGSRPIRGRLPSGSVARYTVALNVFGFFAVALLSGSLAEQRAVGGGAAGPGLDRDCRSPGPEPARHRQPAKRVGDHRRIIAHPDVQSRRRSDHRRVVPLRDRPRDSRRAAVVRPVSPRSRATCDPRAPAPATSSATRRPITGVSSISV